MAPERGLEERIVVAMKELGFTASDARCYLTLLKTSPATGYELAASSGVPRSAIYTVLNRLLSRGLVNLIQKKPARYVPLSPDRLFELIQSSFTRHLDELKDSISRLDKRSHEAKTWTIHGYSATMDMARSMIDGSKQCVHLSIWRREAQRLADPLRRLVSSGIEVVLFSFNQLPDDLGKVLSYGIHEADLEPYWPHKLILVADRARVLVGGVEDSEESQALVSEEPAVVEMAISNLVLDITLLGQRTGKDTSEVITGLTEYLAPLEDMVNGKLGSAPDTEAGSSD